MSLYNLLHGVNPFSPLLCAMVGVRMDEIPRFRDVFLWDVGPDEKGVAIHTRTGGGNREEYKAQNEGLALKPLYVRDEDDDFDCTYATFYYRVPEGLQASLQEIAAIGGGGEEPRQAWERVLTKLRELPVDAPDEEMRNAMEVGRPIVEGIMAVLAAGPVSNPVTTNEKAPAEAGAVEEPEALVAQRAEAEGLEPPSDFSRRISRADQPTTAEPGPTPVQPESRESAPSIHSVRDGATTADHGRPVSNPVSSPDGVALIAAERRRQVEREGWSAEHDDGHDDGALAVCAAHYAMPEDRRRVRHRDGRMVPDGWPFDCCDWKPGDRIRELSKAGALIAAEIDRLQREAAHG